MPVKIREIQKWMEARFPSSWAESWDHIGLQLGNPEREVQRIGITLEATSRSVSWAVQNHLSLLITHHPLFFQPVYSLTIDREPGCTASRMVKEEIALLAAHTNLDAAPDGVSTALAGRLGMIDLYPLENRKHHFIKLVVFIPIGYEEKILSVLDKAGAGQIGNYRVCTFKSRGEGTFKAEPGSYPFMGEIDNLERVSEWRLEVMTPRGQVPELIEKIRRAHPYEEMAYDLYPVENSSPKVGIGRVGRFDPPIHWETLLQRIKQEVEAPSVRVSGANRSLIQKAAVCGGSGSTLIPQAVASGAQIFICGELGYHSMVSLDGQPLTLIEIGHYPSEKWIIPVLAESLREANQIARWEIEVLEDNPPGDPNIRVF